MRPSWMAKKVELVDLNNLIPYAKNFNTHPDEQVDQIVKSIEEFGFVNPILIDKDQGIVAGHGRFQAATRMGLTQVPVIMLEHLTDAQRRGFILADNKIQRNSVFDENLLQEELIALSEDEIDLGTLGWSDEELADLLPDEVEERSVNGNTRVVEGAKEFSEDDFSTFDHKCPKCSFEWNGK